MSWKVKINNDSHDLTDAQLSSAESLFTKSHIARFELSISLRFEISSLTLARDTLKSSYCWRIQIGIHSSANRDRNGIGFANAEVLV